MITRTIAAPQRRHCGKPVWHVRVPKGLLRPGIPKERFFGDNWKAAKDYAKQLADSRKCVGGGGSEFVELTTAEQAAVLTAMNIITPQKS